MSTKSLRKLVQMFGGVPLTYYTTEKMDREAHEAWAGAKAELEAIRAACEQLRQKGCGTSEHDPVLYAAHELLKSIGKEAP